jgi:hypothetical protein
VTCLTFLRAHVSVLTVLVVVSAAIPVATAVIASTVISLAIAVPTTVIASTIMIPAIAVPSAISISIFTVIAASPAMVVSMIIGMRYHNAQPIFLSLFQNGFLELTPVRGRSAVFKNEGTEISGLPGVNQFLKDLRVAFQFGREPQSLRNDPEAQTLFMSGHDGLIIDPVHIGEERCQRIRDRVLVLIMCWNLTGRINLDSFPQRRIINSRLAISVEHYQSLCDCRFQADPDALQGTALVHDIHAHDRHASDRICRKSDTLYDSGYGIGILSGWCSKNSPNLHNQKGQCENETTEKSGFG